jgi:large subunit ribosomal protein L4
MAKLKYLKRDASAASTVEYDASKLGEKPKRSVIREAALMYASNQRSGTHSTKNRSEVAGSGKKLWRQKGTGRARVGDRRMPHWRGGGVVHGPRPRDYKYSLPRKAKVVALRHALLGKLSDGEVSLVDPLGIDKPKTAVVVKMIAGLGLEGTCLIVSPERDDVLYRSARNIPGVSVVTAAEVNAMDIVKYRNVLMVKDALDAVCKRVTS